VEVYSRDLITTLAFMLRGRYKEQSVVIKEMKKMKVET